MLSSWRALVRAVRPLATVAGLSALLAADATAGTATLATNPAAVSAVARPDARARGKTAAAKRAKPGKAAKAAKSAKSSKATKAAKGAARATSRRARAGEKVSRRVERSRAASRDAERREERAAARAAAGRVATAAPVKLEMPVVDVPELSMAAAPNTASASWEAALDFSSTAPGSRPAPSVGTFAALTRSATSLLDGLVARARSQLGTRYVYGAATPGNQLDCSSFVRYVMEALDVRLPRTANQQARVGRPVPRDPSLLRPGDLLTFGSGGFTSHVGIYLGQGRFIHASVKSGRVIETTFDRNSALFRRWQGARRLLAGADTLSDDAGGG